MSWIEERIAESRRLEESDRLVSQHAMSVFDNLWDEIKKLIEEAKKHNFQIFTNGSPENREIRLSTDPTPTQHSSPGREFHLSISKDRKTISVAGPPVSIVFTVGVCPDGVVCLRSDGEPISIQKAAERIFDRLLFPHLPPRS